MGRGSQPSKGKAKPAVSRKSPKNDGARVRDLEMQLAEALRDKAEAQEQQTATAEILRVISNSPTDVQPVFDMLARSARHLCNGEYCVVESFDGERLHFGASDGLTPEGLAAFQQALPRLVTEDNAAGRAVLRRTVVQIPDVREDAAHAVKDVALAANYRSVVAAPMLRDRQPIGAIVVARSSVGFFPHRQIALLQTFADQAVIAIENVRLFKELEASNRELTTALDKQTATSDILRVISQSQTDVQPVFDTILASAVRLLRGYSGLVTRIAGDQIELAALTSTAAAADAALRALSPQSLQSEWPHARAIRDRAPINITDAQTDPRVSEAVLAYARARGYRSWVIVPLLRHDEAIGTIAVTRREPGGFTDDEIALLKTFADQAVIAIENVRLFTETKEALDQQTATAEILGVISRTPTDVQPVFDAIVESGVRLCDGLFGGLVRFDGDLIYPVATHNYTPEALDAMHRVFPTRPSRTLGVGRAILDRNVVHIPDVELDPEYQVQRLAGTIGFRSGLFVPMLLNGTPIGTILVARAEPGPFSDRQIALLRTFADQAVIAIENVRLFTETKEALERQTATAEILRVIASSPAELQPVLDAVAESASRLCEASDAAILLAEGSRLKAVAHFGRTFADAVDRPVSRAGVAGRAVIDRETIHLPDVFEAQDFPMAQQLSRADGSRTVLATPLMREGAALGAILIRRNEVRPFSDRHIALLKTFADQAVIAIENVRLFKELEEKNSALTEALDRQTATAEVLRVISQSQTEVQPVFDAIVNNGMRLFRAWAASIVQVDGELLHTVAVQGGRPGLDQYLREQSPWSIHQPTPVARCIVQRTVIHVPDTELDRYADEAIREVRRRGGMRSILAAPMLRDRQPIGAIWISRAVAGPFSPAEIALIQTFADQAVIAIENARLLSELQASNREIAEKSRQIEVASQHKSEFLANMSHELRTPLNAIIGFSEVLADRMFGELNEKQDEYLKDIYASGTHLLSLINDILDLSKIEAGRMELELSEFDLPTALDNALMLVRERAQRRSLTLNKEVDAGVGQIQADERKIRQVVLNLLSNAIKFTPEGGRIEVAAISKDRLVEVSVSDTGIGIAPEDQEKVFEEFRQVGAAEKKAEGTGLGLTLCRKFIELHGGRIWVQSQVGAGSTFTFTITVRQAE